MKPHLSLKERQKLIQKICFDVNVPKEIEILGSSERWLVYRIMVRERIFQILKTALPLFFKNLGEENTQALIDDFLAKSPPKTRFFRDVVSEFKTFVCSVTHLFPFLKSPEWLAELLELECTKWEVSNEKDTRIKVTPFSFEKAPALNSTVRFIPTKYAVEKISQNERIPPIAQHELCVFRDPNTCAVKVWRLKPNTASLLKRWKEKQIPANQSISQHYEETGIPLDQKEIEKLCDTLEKLMTANIVVGSTNSVDSIT